MSRVLNIVIAILIYTLSFGHDWVTFIPNYTPNYIPLLGGFIGGNAYHYVEENVPRIIACNALRIPLWLPPACNTM